MVIGYVERVGRTRVLMKDVIDGMWRESGDLEGVGSKFRKESFR